MKDRVHKCACGYEIEGSFCRVDGKLFAQSGPCAACHGDYEKGQYEPGKRPEQFRAASVSDK